MSINKKISALFLSVVMVLSISCIGVFADEEIPEGLPAGAYKVAEGIYAAPLQIMPFNLSLAEIGTVPGLGNILVPLDLNSVKVDSGHKWLGLIITKQVRINFVRGSQHVFGESYYTWPQIGGSDVIEYYIDTEYYNMVKDQPYQTHLTSSVSAPRTNVVASIMSMSSKRQ